MYNIAYSINKFESIPDINWCTDKFTKIIEGDVPVETHCALGHCGHRGKDIFWADLNDEELALVKLFGNDYHNVIEVNDGYIKPVELGTGIDPIPVRGNTPKERILNYLKDYKEEFIDSGKIIE